MKHRVYKIVWSESDQEYAALCDTYPSLSWLDRDPVLALVGLIDLIEECEEDIDE